MQQRRVSIAQLSRPTNLSRSAIGLAHTRSRVAAMVDRRARAANRGAARTAGRPLTAFLCFWPWAAEEIREGRGRARQPANRDAAQLDPARTAEQTSRETTKWIIPDETRRSKTTLRPSTCRRRRRLHYSARPANAGKNRRDDAAGVSEFCTGKNYSVCHRINECIPLCSLL